MAGEQSPKPPSTSQPGPSLPSSPSSTTPSSSITRHKSGSGGGGRVRHGRGPLIRDSDDEDEHSHLLPHPNGHGSELEDGRGGALGTSRKRTFASRLRSCCCITFLVLLATVFLVAACLHLWIGHLISTTTVSPKQAIVYSNPTAIRITPFVPPPSSLDDFAPPADAEGLLVEIDLSAAVDLRKAIGWESRDSNQKRSWLRSHVEDPILEKVIRELREVDVSVQDVRIHRGLHTEGSGDNDQGLLVSLPQIPTFTLPLSEHLKPLTLALPLTFPSASAIELAQFVHEIWDNKKWGVEVDIDTVRVHLGGKQKDGEKRKRKGVSGWMERFGLQEIHANRISEKIEGELSDSIPDQDALSSLFVLESYSIYPTNQTILSHAPKPAKTKIALEALVKLSNPLPLLTNSLNFGSDLHAIAFAWHNPFSVPVGVFLPSLPPIVADRRRDQLALLPPSPPNPKPQPKNDILLAHLVIPPFAFQRGQKKVEVVVNGELVEAGRGATSTKEQESEKDRYSKAVSSFLRTYLAGQNNTVLIKYDAPVVPATESAEAPSPPAFLSPLLNSLEAPVIFPGTKEKMDLFENLRIEGMKIKVGPGISNRVSLSTSSLLTKAFGRSLELEAPPPEDGDLLCSGKVVGNILLPDRFAALSSALDITDILPDVFVYDGHLPSIDSGLPYPPKPIPATAFARLKPTESIPAITFHSPANRTHNATTTIEAAFVDAPLFLLDGRSDVFSRFVSKIIFGKALAGARGVSAVELGLEGWGELSLEGLSVEGEFEVGGGGL